MSYSGEKLIDKPALESLFQKIGDRLYAQGLSVDITLYGGSALMLGYALRTSTGDVDATVSQWDEAELKQIAREVGVESGLQPTWFNDDITQLLDEPAPTTLYNVYPDKSKPALRVHIPDVEYMLALQVFALERAQICENKEHPLGKHVSDMKNLAKKLGLNKQQTLSCTKSFFPNRRFPPVVLKWLDVTFNDLENAVI